LLAFLSSLLATHALGAGATPAPTGPAPASASRPAIVVYYDHTEPAITFSARELQKTLRALGHSPATLKPLAELPAAPEPCYVVLAQHTALPVLTLLRNRGGRGTGTMGEQAYALRPTRNNGNRGYWVIGGDRIGAMYGGIHSRARLYSAPNPPFAKKDILDDTPVHLKTWWNLRNDDIFLDKRWGGMAGTDHIGIPKYVFEGKTSGITPLASADQLEAFASAALQGAAEIHDGGKAELRETLGDIRTQARLGQYYASKIRGAVSVGLFRRTGEARHQTEAVAHLEKALTAWHDYARELDASCTNLLYISGQRTFDWFDDSGPRADIEIARKGNP
jgi:hypothetical protein